MDSRAGRTRATASKRWSGQGWGAGLERRTTQDGADRFGFGNNSDHGHCRHGEGGRSGGLRARQKAQDRANRAIIVVLGLILVPGWAVGMPAVRAVSRQCRYFGSMAVAFAVDVPEGQRKLEREGDQRHPNAEPASPPKPAHGLKTHVPTVFPVICNIITIAAVKVPVLAGLLTVQAFAPSRLSRSTCCRRNLKPAVLKPRPNAGTRVAGRLDQR